MDEVPRLPAVAMDRQAALRAACSTNAATTAPSRPGAWRGPKMFDGRAMAQGRPASVDVPLGGQLVDPVVGDGRREGRLRRRPPGLAVDGAARGDGDEPGRARRVGGGGDPMAADDVHGEIAERVPVEAVTLACAARW